MKSIPRPAALMVALAFLLGGCAATGSSPTKQAATGTSATAPARTTPVTVNLGDLNSYNALTTAKQTGTIESALEANGAEARWRGPFAAFVPAHEASLAGEVDISSGGLTNYIMALENGSDLVLLGVDDISASIGIVATADSGVTSIDDLAGKRVAVNQGGTGEYLLLRALDSAGMDLDAAERVYLSPEDAAAAFSAGQVDAWATWDQYFASAQLHDDAAVLTTGTEINSLNYTFEWATREFVEQHPELLDPIIESFMDASAQADSDPGIVGELYLSGGASREVTDLIATWPPSSFRPVDDEVIRDVEQHAEDLARYGITDGVPDLSGAYYVWTGK